MKNREVFIFVGVVLAVLCCVFSAIGYAGYMFIKSKSNTDFSYEAAIETRNTLETALNPNNDPRELALKLKGIKDIPETLSEPPTVYKIGDQKEFNVINTDTNENFKIQADLAYATEHAYLWIQQGVKSDKARVKNLVEAFESKIYPTNREFFGSEWTPGIDGDPHLFIVYTKGLGDNIAGLFSSIDSVNPLARPDSNGHETFFMSADNLNFGDEDYGTLAHEFQHMIHWYRDRNEDTWMNEGFSVLAEFLNGYATGGFDDLYVMNPDQQLTDWPNDPNATRAHYGESFLFLAYFLDRFGEKATQALVAEPENGMDAIDKVLIDTKAIDPKTGKQITADDVYADWVVAMLLKDPTAGDGRYTYKNYPNSPRPDATEVVTDCPTEGNERSVSQYGVDYIQINCKGDYHLTFQGVLQTGVLAENPHSGKYAFWSNKGDESDMTLTREFDFTSIPSPINFDFWIWYDLEKDYDFTYLEYSVDGQSWTIIPTMSCTSENKSGNSYGCGWNDTSDGWKKESVDLSFLAGKKVQLRFEYITDAAVNGEGLMLDDLAITAAKYQTDFEKDDGGWIAAGFVRIQNQLPQTYRVTLIENGEPTLVMPIELDGSNQATIPVSIQNGKNSAVLVVSGTTRFSRQPALYQFSLTK